MKARSPVVNVAFSAEFLTRKRESLAKFTRRSAGAYARLLEQRRFLAAAEAVGSFVGAAGGFRQPVAGTAGQH